MMEDLSQKAHAPQRAVYDMSICMFESMSEGVCEPG